jgi:glycerol-3-phosphate dehydrogenase
MRKVQTEILVIGGGATGTGILRDLAMRGFRALLVEKRDIAHGTTGRYHGLLHSGARYAVKDSEAACECNQENQILRRIMPHCIEDTGGFFVLTPWDDASYMDQFLAGCQTAGIPVEEVPIRQMLTQEPLLNSDISRCLRVPDAAADSFAAAHANIASASAYGAQALTYHEVKTLFKESSRITGVRCYDLVHDEIVDIYADVLINASGAWAGKIGATVGIDIKMRPGKGTMIAANHRIVHTVINRLKMPSDGDILVPAHTVAVIGTTDEQIPDPDNFAIEPWEIHLLLEEGEKIIPGFSQLRFLRAWAGVRPLYQETKTVQSRDIPRSYVLLDHQERDGVTGMLTITSGKWTTYRKMAEVTVDKVCEKLGTVRQCRTHLEELPTDDRRRKTGNSSGRWSSVSGYHSLGQRLARIEAAQSYGDLICECELVTHTDVEEAILWGDAKSLDDIRRDTRLGMGPCQGGFCTLRAAGILHQLSVNGNQLSVEQTNTALRDFLQERWKGVLPILWGQQLRQERLNELIYVNVLNVEALPGESASRLRSENYEAGSVGTWEHGSKGAEQEIPFNLQQTNTSTSRYTNSPTPIHTLVIGGGFSGLVAAWRAAQNGGRTRLIAKGWGTTHWGSGCIDVLGYYPADSPKIVESPISTIARLMLEMPEHPYAVAGLKTIEEALNEIKRLYANAGYPLHGSLEMNLFLPTVIGTFRPTCLVPETMIAGDLNDRSPILLVGFEGYHDFYPHFAAENLKLQGIPAEAVVINLPSLQPRHRVDALTLARLFENPDFRAELANSLRPYLGNAERIGFPAVLGMQDPLGVMRSLESYLGRRVFEMVGLPPSIPGLRLHQILVAAIQAAGSQVYQGMEVIETKCEAAKVVGAWTEAASRPLYHQSQNFVLATGGFLGGGFTAHISGYAKENCFDLPLVAPGDKSVKLEREFLHPKGHPIFKMGIKPGKQFHTSFGNLYAVGNGLLGDFLRERSLEGVALVSGYLVGETLA